MFSTSGTSTENVKEVQKLRLVPQQLFEVAINADQITGGTYEVQFCDFSVKLPGFVQYAPTSNQSQIIVITEESDVNQVWRDFGVYAGYPIRISIDETRTGQQNTVYMINLDSCAEDAATDNCVVVIPLSRPYEGSTIRNGRGSVWGCDFTQRVARIATSDGPAQVTASIEGAIGDGTVYAVAQGTRADINFNITFDEAQQYLYARLGVVDLRGSGISGKLTIHSSGLDTSLAFDKTGQGWKGSFRIKLGDDVTALLSPGISTTALEQALQSLSLVGPDVRVAKSVLGWDYSITFVNEIGDVELLQIVYEESDVLHPLGARVAVETTRQGEAMLDGLFEITWNGANSTVPVDASAESFRSLLESSFGLTDVSVARTGPSASNGYQWTVTYVGDCPFETTATLLKLQNPCHISLEVGERTKTMLTGNNAELSIRQPMLAELPSTLTWTEDMHIPESLEAASSTDEANFILDSPGVYKFSSGSRTRTVYTNALPPKATVTPTAVEVLAPRDFATLNGTGSHPRTSASITVYKWTLMQAPKPNSGQVSQPSKELTVALDLNTAGDYLYKLEVVDTLGLSGCSRITVSTRFPPLLNPIGDVEVVPDDDLSVQCVVAQGSEPLTLTWLFEGIPMQAQTTATLKLNSVKEYDQGNYTCHVQNSYGTAEESFIVRVKDAPLIVTAPENTAGAAPGSTVRFSCVATGEPPLHLAWQFSYGVIGPWQTLMSAKSSPSELTVTDITSEDEGYYRCIANNSIGSVASSPAKLEILTAPSSVELMASPAQKAYDPRASLVLSCEAQGLNLEYRWIFEGSILQGALNTTLRFESLNESDHGEYVCEVENAAGKASSAAFKLVVNTAPVFTLQPLSNDVDPGKPHSFVVNATGKEPIQYLWSHNGEYLYGDEYYSNRLVLSVVEKPDEGEYLAVAYNDIGFSKSATAYLRVNDPPLIQTHPQDSTVDPGEATAFFCNATGTPDLIFYWVRATDSSLQNPEQVSTGQESFGEKDATLSFETTSLEDQGYYACVATNSAGEARSSFAKLHVNRGPWIISHPNDTYVDPGAYASLHVVAGGAEPLTFQWRVDGAAIPQSNSATLIIANADVDDEGGYDCRVTNRLNPTPGVLSNIARLIIAKPPQIVEPPKDSIVLDPLRSGELSVAVLGAPPIHYTLYKLPNKVVSHGEVAASGDIKVTLNVTEADEGKYVFFVYNRLGNVSSNEATLIVNDPPVVTTAFQKMTVDPESNLTLDCQVEASPAVSSVTWIFESVGGGRETPPTAHPFQLHLSKVSQNAEGRYFCFAQNSAGSTQKLVADITVRDPPTIVKILPLPAELMLSLDPGEVVTFEALTTGLEPITYRWFRNDILIKESTEPTLQVTADATIENGPYTLVAENALGSDTSAPFQLFLNEPADVRNFTVLPTKPRVLPNAFVSFRCQSTGAPPITFTWLQDGQELSNSSVHSIIQSSQGVSTLEISQARADFHSGSYQCSVVNSANPVGSTSEPIHLVVVVAPLLQLGYPRDKNQFPGEAITFECRADEGSPPFEVQWYRGSEDKVLLDPSASTKFQYSSTISGTTSVLTITDTVEVDQDLYSCKICNELGCVSSRLAALGVHDSPLITYQMPSAQDPVIEVDPMARVELTVSASGLEPLSFQWREAGSDRPVTTGERIFYQPTVCEEANKPCVLVFKNASDADEGLYYCRVTNSLGGISSTEVEIHVRDLPTLEGVWPQVLENSCPGIAFNFPLNITGSPPIAVSWFFQVNEPREDLSDILLRPISLESGNEHRFFLREPVPSQHSGFYAFKARNSAGEYLSSVAYLKVNPGPSAAADADGLSPKHSITLPQTFTQLRGVASQGVVSYAWSVVSAPNEKKVDEVVLLEPFSSVCNVIGLDVAGTYVFMLTVVGVLGCVDSDTVVVTVNHPPVAIADSLTVAIGHQEVILDGSRSYDLDSNIVAYLWELVVPSPGVLFEHPNASTTRVLGITMPRVISVRLTVWDAVLVKASIVVQVDALDVVVKPIEANQVSMRSSVCEAQDISWTVNGGLLDFDRLMTYILVVDELTGETEVVAKQPGQTYWVSESNQYFYSWLPTSAILDRPFTVRVAFGDSGMVAKSQAVTRGPPVRYQTEFSECTASCGVGKLLVTSYCVEDSSTTCSNSSFLFNVSDHRCAHQQRPAEVQSCLLRACEGAQWRVGPWYERDFGSSRVVECVDTTGQVVDSSFCPDDKPSDEMKPSDEVIRIQPPSCPVLQPRVHQCFDVSTGLPRFDDKSCALQSDPAVTTNDCPQLWTTEEWRLQGTLAVREASCSGCAEAIKPALNREVFSEIHNKLNTHFWTVGPWSSCAEELQTRDVVCANGFLEVEEAAKCAAQMQPIASRQCGLKCGEAGLKLLADTCVCPLGWSGVNCTTPTHACVSNGGVLSSSGACCTNGMVDKTGYCCEVGARLDKEGMCCNERVDICGTCGGFGRYIDLTGACCENILDASGMCCSSGIVDRCGVCDGTGLSCYVTVEVEPDSETGLTLESALNRSGDLRAFKVFITANNSIVQFGALAALGSTVGETEIALRSLARNQSAVRGVGQRGVCGNGLCEVGERCYRSAVNPECCPDDCPVSIYKNCTDGCSGHGVCNPRVGKCECFQGYEGDRCTRCSGDAWHSAVAKQCIILSALPRAFSQTVITSGSPPAIWPIIVGVLLCLFACVLLLYALKQKRDASRRDNFLLDKSHKVVAQPVPPAGKKLELADDGCPQQDVDYDHCGWLWKRCRPGKDGKGVWQQWYVVLSMNELWYFESDIYFQDHSWATLKEQEAIQKKMRLAERGCIDLRKVSHAEIPNNIEQGRKGSFPFDLALADERPINLMASSEAERQAWLEKLSSYVHVGLDARPDLYDKIEPQEESPSFESPEEVVDSEDLDDEEVDVMV